jgi:hypothetical protein
MTAYWQLLRDPRWQRVRLEIMQRDEFRCRACGAEHKPLNVHHSYYAKGRSPWEYEPESLRTLCEDCHQSSHTKMAEISRLLGTMPPEALDCVLGYVRGNAAVLNLTSDHARILIPTENAEQARGLFAAFHIVGRTTLDGLLIEAQAEGGFDVFELINIMCDQSKARNAIQPGGVVDG